jgi:hypothetical protein
VTIILDEPLPQAAPVLDEPLLPTEDAARHLKIKPQTMAAWRNRGAGPEYVRVGKLIFYTPSQLRKYIQSRVVRPMGGARETSVQP